MSTAMPGMESWTEAHGPAHPPLQAQTFRGGFAQGRQSPRAEVLPDRWREAGFTFGCEKHVPVLPSFWAGMEGLAELL